MADVFISYSKSHIALTRDLARDIEAKGLTVWWDTELLAGESFRERIVQELKACKAAIVIWMRDSIQSPYVLSEAERARVASKLIQVRTADVSPSELPPPFDTSHAPLIDDRRSIFGALSRLGVLRNYTAAESERLPFSDGSQVALKRSIGKRIVAALGALIFVGIVVLAGIKLAHIVSEHEETKGRAANFTLASKQESRAVLIANRFFENVNAGLLDSSLFDEDVRLGRRGLMSKVEAVGELRKLWSKYSKIDCRMDRNSLTLKQPEFAQNGFRVRIETECDFTDQSGAARTERFPLEIEAAPDPSGKLLISGLWQSETLWFWQPRGRD